MRLRPPGARWRSVDAFERAARRLARRGLCNRRVSPNRFCGRPAENGELCHRHFEIVLHGKVLHDAHPI
jgi:hypothetical protein